MQTGTTKVPRPKNKIKNGQVWKQTLHTGNFNSRTITEIWSAAITDYHWTGFWWVPFLYLFVTGPLRHSQFMQSAPEKSILSIRECLQIVLLIYKACLIFKNPTMFFNYYLFHISILHMTKNICVSDRCQQDFWNRWIVMGEGHKNKA